MAPGIWNQVTMISYRLDDQPATYEQILKLQAINARESTTPEVWKDQGFVTARHTPELLDQIHGGYGHLVAFADDRVVGYALVMLPQFAEMIPVLTPMFVRIEKIAEAQGNPDWMPYVAMGQVCVAESHRGQGVFQGLYDHYRLNLQRNFRSVITEVSSENPRSLRAHYRQGFVVMETRTGSNGVWQLVRWDF